MFGYACDETPDLMPLPIWTRPPPGRAAGRGAQVRRRCRTCARTARPRSRSSTRTAGRSRLKTVLISTQHQEGVDRDTVIRPDLIEQVIRPTIPEQFADDDYERVRSTRPARSCSAARTPTAGLTGRKIIVDTLRRHGPPRRRRVQRQGPEQGRPLGGVRRPLGGQARRGQRRGDALRGAGRLRHRHGPPDEHPRRDVRHQHRAGGRHREGRAAHEAGGSDLDTLFVDEGFGSLDAETLDEVLDTLDSLRDGGRVVGVVSHVAEMRDRIPTQLHVSKQPARFHPQPGRLSAGDPRRPDTATASARFGP